MLCVFLMRHIQISIHSRWGFNHKEKKGSHPSKVELTNEYVEVICRILDEGLINSGIVTKYAAASTKRPLQQKFQDLPET